MNTKDFIRLGIPLGEATRRATDFISKFILAGGDKTRLEEEVKAIIANPSAFTEDSLRGELAKALLKAPPPPRTELTHSEVTRHRGSKGGTTYGVDIRYRYVVNDRSFEGRRSATTPGLLRIPAWAVKAVAGTSGRLPDPSLLQSAKSPRRPVVTRRGRLGLDAGAVSDALQHGHARAFGHGSAAGCASGFSGRSPVA